MNKAKQEFINRRMSELKETGINPSIVRVTQEWSRSDERMNDMFKGIRGDVETTHESNFLDADDAGFDDHFDRF